MAEQAPASIWAWIALSALLVVVVAIPGGLEFGRGWVAAAGWLVLWSVALLRRWRAARTVLVALSLFATVASAALLVDNGGPADGFLVALLFAAGTFMLTRPATRRWCSGLPDPGRR